MVATLQRQGDNPAKLLDVLDVETGDATHWPRGYGKAWDSHDVAFRSESRAVSQACLKMATRAGKEPSLGFIVVGSWVGECSHMWEGFA